MRAVEIKEFGGPEGLTVVDRPDPVAAAGQVVIASEAIGVGGVDVMIRRGAYAAYGFRPGFVPGSEVAGTVTATGDGVDPGLVGQRVWAFTGTGGAYADQAVAAIGEVVPLPRDLSAVDAVTLGSAGIVAHFGLAHAHFAPGESVLVRGASGSIGIMTVQLAARAGAAVVAVTTSSPDRGRRLRELGATQVLDRSGSVSDGSAYDVIIDVVAGADLPSFFDRLNPGGRLVAVGAVGGQPPADFGARLMAAFQKSMSFATFSAATVPENDRRRVRAEQFAAAARGELRTVVHEVMPLTSAALAHRAMDAGTVFGRIVLTP
ncbi:zinc-binding dehydrogenase [Actinoplanes awajinensis]|uniref:NADPH:quinone reductase n=1 Tax=Actinoplanes awajinensis subsp. mycoplanecinus TaxID=135947 RepID=A0A101JRZ5_9ACTN|nr:zinc-binding dehydrogenase [Actinoplanes awajinensis]KUL32000.1 NADPH:quinone reductase [Actinoplanes awajinensis subsp. mycoplanecinus]